MFEQQVGVMNYSITREDSEAYVCLFNLFWNLTSVLNQVLFE